MSVQTAYSQVPQLGTSGRATAAQGIELQNMQNAALTTAQAGQTQIAALAPAGPAQQEMDAPRNCWEKIAIEAQ